MQIEQISPLYPFKLGRAWGALFQLFVQRVHCTAAAIRHFNCLKVFGNWQVGLSYNEVLVLYYSKI